MCERVVYWIIFFNGSLKGYERSLKIWLMYGGVEVQMKKINRSFVLERIIHSDKRRKYTTLSLTFVNLALASRDSIFKAWQYMKRVHINKFVRHSSFILFRSIAF